MEKNSGIYVCCCPKSRTQNVRRKKNCMKCGISLEVFDE